MRDKDDGVVDRKSLTWPNWFCDQAVLCKHIEQTLGGDACVDWEAGYARAPGYIEVVGSGERFRLLLFIRSAEQRGWEATEKMLVPAPPDDSGLAGPRQGRRMLDGKKHFFMVEPTKSCPLSFQARWVYSFLLFRTAMGKPAAEACIFRNCGLCNRGVKGYLAELRDAGLLAEANDRFFAREPSAERWPWFVSKGNAESLPWFQCFASFAVYVPNPHQGLPLTHSALLSLVWSLKHDSGWLTIRPAALAAMLFPELNRASAKRQTNRAIKNLREKGLLDDHWNVTVKSEHHHYWRDADHLANLPGRSDVGYGGAAE